MKKKGSALVFSVLMLSFFLAISLNIFFQARKKAERAGVKVQGEKTTNNIDMASSLGYQELLIAENFVRIGFPYDDTHPSHSSGSDFNSYPVTTGNRSKLYLLEDGFYTAKYPGIQINNFIDFFASQWILGDASNQKIIIGEEIVGGVPLRRMWQSSGIENKLIPLWDPDVTGRSIGGYKLISKSFDTSTNTPGATATYEKLIKLNRVPEDEAQAELIPESIFKITVVETFDYSTTTGASNRSITSFIVKSLK